MVAHPTAAGVELQNECRHISEYLSTTPFCRKLLIEFNCRSGTEEGKDTAHAISLPGCRLQGVLGNLSREIIDVTVEFLRVDVS